MLRSRHKSVRATRKRPRRQLSPIPEPLDISTCPTTPPDRFVSVDVEQVRTQLAAAGLGDSPTSRRRGALQRRKLFSRDECKSADNVPPPPWDNRELKALVTFLMLYTDGKTWTSRKGDDSFWDGAGRYIQSQVLSAHCRTGKACRTRVFSKLCHEFASPAEAERHFNELEMPLETSAAAGTRPQVTLLGSTVTALDPGCTSEDSTGACQRALARLPPDSQLEILSLIFSEVVGRHPSAPTIPQDFLKLVLRGMQQLHAGGRSNIIYNLAKALGTLRSDGATSLMPVHRMPVGLIEYAVNFFTASSVQKVSCPPDYRSWLQTMYVLFGSKWAKVFNGPMWSYEPIMQVRERTTPCTSMCPTNALVNVPALSERTLRRDIEKNDISTGSEIQVHVLQEAKASDPHARWWIKGDGVDVVKGLWESTRGQWSGDVDLGDGQLQLLYQKYQERLGRAKELGLEQHTAADLEADLTRTLKDVTVDLEFLHSQLQKTNAEYESRHKAGKTAEKVTFSLTWDITELKRLNDLARNLHADLVDVSGTSAAVQQECNIPRRLASIRSQLCDLVKGVFRFRRTPATHIFMLMISSEFRDRKPYALPVQCISYAGLTETNMRNMVTNLVKKMVTCGLSVAGFVSNGEFNYMRSKGYTRPLSVLQIRTDIRKKYNKVKLDVLLDMLTPEALPDGSIAAKYHNPAVPSTVLREITLWKAGGVSMDDIVDRLRMRTVPPGYVPCMWTPGKTEGMVDKLRSIVAQFELRHHVQQWEERGVPFRTHLYVPEVHPVTGEAFCEREDEAHVLKRIANHTRSGGPSQLNLEHYVEALSDPSSCLTYPALTGARKQSVVDAERLFSPELAAFTRLKGHSYEAKYIETIWNWRRACDHRGLSELERCRFNYAFLNLILDELMPWHQHQYDFGLLEVNRPINSILGFSRETLIAVVTNIEGREWRRRLSASAGLRPEHPRASTSDDVECFFSMMRDTIGQNFTTKQVRYGFRKVCLEFVKRLDPDLPFYYHTSSHTRFYEGPLPEFSQASMRRPRKSNRIPRREQPAAFSIRRATLPVHGSLTVRAQFHNRPLDLPPPPTGPITLHEHSYSKK